MPDIEQVLVTRWLRRKQNPQHTVGRTAPSRFPLRVRLARHLTRIFRTRRIHGLTSGNQALRAKARKRVSQIARQTGRRPCGSKSTWRYDCSSGNGSQEANNVRERQGEDFESNKVAVGKIPGGEVSER
jgi:hypothetical protein